MCQRYCQFPEYLWAGSQNPRIWTTQERFGDETHETTSHVEIIVTQTVIEFWMNTRSLCFNESKAESEICHKREMVEKMHCLQEEAGNKLRVQIKEKRSVI